MKDVTEDYKSTEVRETADGYVVNLLTETSLLCGCGLHTTDMVNLMITQEGEIKRLDSKPAYQFEACLDQNDTKDL